MKTNKVDSFGVAWSSCAILSLFCVFAAQASSRFAVNVDKYLFRAAKRGDFDYFKKLVEKKGANVNYRAMDGKTVLIRAASNKKGKIVQYLLSLEGGNKKKRVELDSVDGKGETALFKSCKQGDLPVVKILLGAGAKINTQNKKGDTPLIMACKKGYLEIVQELIKNGAYKETQNDSGNTALHEAVRGHQNKIVEFLVKNGANKSVKNKNGKIPVDYARLDTKRLLEST